MDPSSLPWKILKYFTDYSSSLVLIFEVLEDTQVIVTDTETKVFLIKLK